MMDNDSRLVLAYIDPGGGEFLLQLILGGMAAWAFRFRRIVLSVFRSKHEIGAPKAAAAADPVADSAK